MTVLVVVIGHRGMPLSTLERSVLAGWLAMRQLNCFTMSP
jgi:hypothetical protein